jgi:dimethylglycine dehydrogenase
MHVQRYSLGLYAGLAGGVDYLMNSHVTDPILLALSRARMMEFERAKSIGRAQAVGPGDNEPGRHQGRLSGYRDA